MRVRKPCHGHSNHQGQRRNPYGGVGRLGQAFSYAISGETPVAPLLVTHVGGQLGAQHVRGRHSRPQPHRAAAGESPWEMWRLLTLETRMQVCRRNNRLEPSTRRYSRRRRPPRCAMVRTLRAELGTEHGSLSRYLKYVVAQVIMELWRWISVGALVFQAAASSAVTSRQTAKRSSISVRHWVALSRCRRGRKCAEMPLKADRNRWACRTDLKRFIARSRCRVR
jgi:hypothetical protein